MPSPFPGMNPYLEQEETWQDFHQRFVPLLAGEIGKQAPDRYIIKLEQHVYIHELSEEARQYAGRADIGISLKSSKSDETGGVATIAPPLYGELSPAMDRERLAYIEIRDRQSRQLVTVVELLSPTNKRPGPDRDRYAAKRNEYLHQRVNFVELDLLRGYPRLPTPGLPACDYYVLVKRDIEWPRIGLWPLSLRERLPEIPIPLAPPDSDVRIELQDILNQAYDLARYGSYIYVGSPQPPLNSTDAQWANHILELH
jgi:hypothetical protein